MSITTRPVFYYTEGVDSTAFTIDFVEPSVSPNTLTAILNAGGYSLTELANEVSRALNATGTQGYTVSVNRSDRVFTISSSGTFNLLFSSGPTSGSSIASRIGFDAADLTSATTYDGQNGGGSEYEPQFLLQNFIGFEDNEQFISPSVNESSSGVVEVISYGSRRFMRFNIRFITDNHLGDNGYITNNPNGIQEARDFLEFCIQKKNLEFMKDRDNRSAFDTVLLERTRQSRTGTAYELRELYNLNLLGYYESGTLTFRRID